MIVLKAILRFIVYNFGGEYAILITENQLAAHSGCETADLAESDPLMVTPFGGEAVGKQSIHIGRRTRVLYAKCVTMPPDLQFVTG